MKKILFTTAIAWFAMSDQATATDPEVSCLAQNIYHEARNQSLDGQIAVGQVTLNRVEDKRFPNTVCEVITQGHHQPSWEDPSIEIPIKNRCQFSWYCDGRSDEIENIEIYSEIVGLAKMLIEHEIHDNTSGATHYHANYVTPDWAETKTKTIEIGDHIFYRWEF